MKIWYNAWNGNIYVKIVHGPFFKYVIIVKNKQY